MIHLIMHCFMVKMFNLLNGTGKSLMEALLFIPIHWLNKFIGHLNSKIKFINIRNCLINSILQTLMLFAGYRGDWLIFISKSLLLILMIANIHKESSIFNKPQIFWRIMRLLKIKLNKIQHCRSLIILNWIVSRLNNSLKKQHKNIFNKKCDWNLGRIWLKVRICFRHHTKMKILIKKLLLMLSTA